MDLKREERHRRGDICFLWEWDRLREGKMRTRVRSDHFIREFHASDCRELSENGELIFNHIYMRFDTQDLWI